MNLRRVFRTFTAHGYGLGVSIFSTILLPSICIAQWGASGYGHWVTVAALSQFFVFIDFGVSNALANQLCLRNSINTNEAQFLIRAAQKLYRRRDGIALLSLAVATACLSAYHTYIGDGNAVWLPLTFIFLALSAMLRPIFGVYYAVQRFKGRNEWGIFATNTYGLIEFAVIAAATLAGASMAIVALTALILKIVVAAGFHFRSRLDDTTAAPLTASQQEELVRAFRSEVVTAGKGFTMLALGANLSLHGSLVVVSACLGPIAAAVFVAARTISRLPFQLTGLLFSSLNPELTATIASGQQKLFRILVFRFMAMNTTLALLAGAVALAFLPTIEKVWLHNALTVPPLVLSLMLVGTVVHLGWQTLSQSLAAVNKTYGQGKGYLAICTLTIPATFLATLLGGMQFAAIIILLGEFVVLIMVWLHWREFDFDTSKST